jgi:hypothetical protein
MSSAEATDTKRGTDGDIPTLPENVCIFSPATPTSAKALLNGRMFTRLAISAQTTPLQLVNALRDNNQRGVDDTFHLCHRSIILIFDGAIDGKDLQDTHHEHFRAVCLVLKDNDISLDVAGSVFDVSTPLQAGFQLEEMSSGSVLAVDVMGGDDGSDDDDDDDDEDDDAGVQWFPVDEDVEGTKS